ncbi:hypothetical protein ABPG75_008767 [Micractinium tetrahymenae]
MHEAQHAACNSVQRQLKSLPVRSRNFSINMAALIALAVALQPYRGPWAPSASRKRSAVHAGRSLHAQRTVNDQFVLEVRQGYVQNAVEVSKLLTQVFHSWDPLDEDDSSNSSGGGGGSVISGPPGSLQYQLKLLAALQWRAGTLGRGLVTVTATDAASGQLAGCANLTPGLALTGAAEHVELPPGSAAATVSNMAVAPAFRRRGLGRALLTACERAAAELYAPPASLLALSVYRQNEAAVQLYEGSGWRLDEGWVDPRWAEAAERGRVGFARRLLMLKWLPLGCGSGSGAVAG